MDKKYQSTHSTLTFYCEEIADNLHGVGKRYLCADVSSGFKYSSQDWLLFPGVVFDDLHGDHQFNFKVHENPQPLKTDATKEYFSGINISAVNRLAMHNIHLCAFDR